MNANASGAGRRCKPRPKPARHVRLCKKPEGTSPGVLRITVGKQQDAYFLTELPADFGCGFLVQKVGLDVMQGQYHVNIDDDNKTCDCKGHTHHGHFKHADGIAARSRPASCNQTGG
jgi:hypothetical protein